MHFTPAKSESCGSERKKSGLPDDHRGIIYKRTDWLERRHIIAPYLWL